MVGRLDTFDNSEEAKRGLSQEVASLRKQSVFALILALLFILLTVYLYFQLKESNANLQASKALLETQNDSITNLKNLLSDFREQYLKESAPAVAAAAPPYSNRPRTYMGRQITKANNWESCFGYIVYIQDRRGSQLSEPLRQLLKDKGAIVPDIEHIGNRLKFSSSVRYFHKEDQAMAEFMHGLILETLDSRKIPNLARQWPISYIENDKVPLGQLEIWIDS